MIEVRICGYYSIGIDDLATFLPDKPDNFAYTLDVQVCPLEGRGVETFRFHICTPNWLADRLRDRPVLSGRHQTIVARHDINAILEHIERFVHSISADTWDEFAHYMNEQSSFADRYNTPEEYP